MMNTELTALFAWISSRCPRRIEGIDLLLTKCRDAAKAAMELSMAAAHDAAMDDPVGPGTIVPGRVSLSRRQQQRTAAASNRRGPCHPCCRRSAPAYSFAWSVSWRAPSAGSALHVHQQAVPLVQERARRTRCTGGRRPA